MEAGQAGRQADWRCVYVAGARRRRKEKVGTRQLLMKMPVATAHDQLREKFDTSLVFFRSIKMGD